MTRTVSCQVAWSGVVSTWSVRAAAEAAVAPQADIRRRHPRILIVRRRYLGDIVLLGSLGVALVFVLFLIWAPFFLYTLWRFRASKSPKADYNGVRSHLSTYQDPRAVQRRPTDDLPPCCPAERRRRGARASFSWHFLATARKLRSSGG